ncbi:amidoligase family protein [Parasulfitobacter algicola]|uniref:Amidoligase family protein n=1 Tax=Parasulfitobacter algicola TaxID=2614809 RepID=A0ABX2IPR9_9RHOB|nr:amidoligase family protein [Sulfitobacter algicola]NSX53996.1 amidoligase family protein [Sulfitobacter algicola]
MFDQISKTDVHTLPIQNNADGDIRKVGIEIELGGLDEAQATSVLKDNLGGSISVDENNDHLLKDSEIGDVEIYLDIRYRKDDNSKLMDLGIDLSRSVVPIEIVTQPVEPSQISVIDIARNALREKGAMGSRSGILLGYGVHLNIEIVSPKLKDILPTLKAFALLEDVLRDQDQMDISRRALPFSDPYPRRFIDCLVAEEFEDVDDLIDLYLEETPTRNRALDMLPIFAHIAPDRVAKDADSPSISARPAFHYRMPDCRIDEKDWSIAYEWNRWVAVEQIANSPDVMAALERAWRDQRASWTTVRWDWAKTAKSILDDSEQKVTA